MTLLFLYFQTSLFTALLPPHPPARRLFMCFGSIHDPLDEQTDTISLNIDLVDGSQIDITNAVRELNTGKYFNHFQSGNLL